MEDWQQSENSAGREGKESGGRSVRILCPTPLLGVRPLTNQPPAVELPNAFSSSEEEEGGPLPIQQDVSPIAILWHPPEGRVWVRLLRFAHNAYQRDVGLVGGKQLKS
jgi:hypothetical protein